MDFQEAWARALKDTQIVRTRVSSLHTFDDTRVPYIMLSPSSVNDGDTVVRKGEVVVQRPSLILPPNIPQFEGFDFDEVEAGAGREMLNFLLVRGISIPSMKYDNRTYSLDVFEGDIPRAVAHHANILEREEDVRTGLLTGHEDVWPFAITIFICSQVARNAEIDLRRLMEQYRNNN
ncbi:MAG: hypothetical protein HQL19_02215 [Candidatus Omnitrophica bacterium]|nr:hypothetical protein [Candidatus Omnitrophota bacterium]